MTLQCVMYAITGTVLTLVGGSDFCDQLLSLTSAPVLVELLAF